MLFSKNKHLVGLDIGSSTIKACELVYKKGYSLKNLATVEIDPGFIVDGVINQPSELAHAVRALFDENRIKERNVALAVYRFDRFNTLNL